MSSQSTFSLEIITPISSRNLAVEWVEIESPTGSFFVGPNHIPLISIIKNKSSVTYKEIGAESRSIDVSYGIFKISNNKAFILLDE